MDNPHAEHGTKVVFIGFGGYHSDRLLAYQHLNVGHIYTVDKTVADRWHSDVFLIEALGIPFNSALLVKSSKVVKTD